MDFITIVMKIANSVNTNKKKEGFEGQKAIIIPRKILTDKFSKNPIINCLYITDIGYYPKAKFHYIERSHGSGQHILIYCIDGKGSVKIGKETFIVEPGNYFLIPSGQPHTYKSDESTPWTIYWLHFKGTVSESIILFLKEQLNGYKGNLQYKEERIAIFKFMYNQLERGYSNDNIVSANMQLWQYLTSFIFPRTILSSIEYTKIDISELSIDFMRKNIENTVTLEALAKSANLSPSHFSFLFKSKTGFPPMEYFNHLKVQKACQFLLFTSLRIKEIAFKLGIEDAYYFSRLFTKVMGIPPNKYRQRRIQ
jgi:AraC-like DNA-binding protein/uncharacterized RmlC-like cupin family protein